jgi:hypothetical protein
MFGWLFPRSPLAPAEKAWTETHLLGLARHLGLARLQTTSVPLPDQIALLSTDDDGLADPPRKLRSTPREVQVVATRCATQAITTAGDVVKIPEGLLGNPYAVAAAMVRELSFQQLPAQWQTQPNQRQTLWLADLTAICLGWGVILAHPLSDALPEAAGGACSCAGNHPGHYLPARMIGYALALITLVRDETAPDWRPQLRPDALAVFDRARSYLRRTHDTLFTRESAAQPSDTQNTEQLVHQLATGSPSARVAALWALRDESHVAVALPPVTRCLHDRIPVLREEAARTLACYGAAATPALPALIDLLHDSQYSIRAAAALAVGQSGARSELALEQLTYLLDDPEPLVVRHAAEALAPWGPDAQIAIPAVLAALRGAMIRCDHALIEILTHTLYALDPDPTTRVMEFFDEDPELREQVVHWIVDALGEQGDRGLA